MNNNAQSNGYKILIIDDDLYDSPQGPEGKENHCLFGRQRLIGNL